LSIHTVIRRYLQKARTGMVRVRAVSLIIMPLSLVGCLTTQPGTSVAPSVVAQPAADGFRTTTEGPVSRPEPISAEARENLEGQGGFAVGRRVALIIGNSDYQGSISSLVNPANDARAMAASLGEVGFEVDLQLDATRDEIKEAVLDFSDKLHDSDVGLFYYAGHAVQVDGKNFMIPVGADLNIKNDRRDALSRYVGLKTVDINEVLGSMENAEAALNIVILDACRDNPFEGTTRGLSRGLAQTFAPRGTFVAYATAPGQVAEDGRSNNSPYTSALVEAIRTPGLKLEDTFKQVRREVALETDGRQTPWENSSIYGDFYFTPPAPTPEPVTATIPKFLPPAPAPAPEPAPVVTETRVTPPIVDENETAVRTKPRGPSNNTFIITP